MNELFEHAGTAISQSEVISFSFNGSAVRTLKDANGEPWFVAKDVCDVLDLGNTGQALNSLDSDEKNSITINDGNPGNPTKAIISESGMYSLVLRSRKPEAKAFKRWVTGEVLPSIRKHGGYIHANADMSDDEIMARALEVAHRTIERKDAQIKEQEEQLKLQAPDVQYCNYVLAAKNLHTVNSIAVHLGISPIRLNRFLVDSGYIYKQGGIYYPSCKIRDKGYCDFQHVPYINSNGDKMTREHLKWTETGRRFVIEAYKNKKSER